MKKLSYVITALLIIGSALYCGYQWGAFAYVILFFFVIFISWFLHKEMVDTRRKNAFSENDLRKEREDLEQEIKKKTAELKTSEHHRMYELGKIAEFGRLSQGLFHDLLSPLSGLALHMEKAKNLSREEFEQSHASLVNIANTSRKMSETLEQLREHMADSLPARDCNLKKEINYSLRLLRFKTNERNVKISIMGDDSCLWYGDAIKIRQVFTNIISNALDAFPDAQEDKRIDIRIQRHDTSATIQITDNGVGMDNKVIEKIFEPYFTTKTPDKGSGIGLSLVRKILNEIGGEIKVKSTPGVGSTFTIIIQ